MSTRIKSGKGRKPRARDTILNIIKSNPGICREDIWVETRLAVSWASICRNTLWLEKAGLVTCQKVGQWHFFKRNDAVIQTFIERIGQEL